MFTHLCLIHQDDVVRLAVAGCQLPAGAQHVLHKDLQVPKPGPTHKCTQHSKRIAARHSVTHYCGCGQQRQAGVWIYTLTSAQCITPVCASQHTQTHAEARSTAPPARPPVCTHQLKSTVNCAKRLARNASHSCCVASMACPAVRPSYRCVFAFLLRVRRIHAHTHIHTNTRGLPSEFVQVRPCCADCALQAPPQQQQQHAHLRTGTWVAFTSSSALVQKQCSVS